MSRFAGESVSLFGATQTSLAVSSAVAATTAALAQGYYHVWASTPTYILLGTTSVAATTANGYLISTAPAPKTTVLVESSSDNSKLQGVCPASGSGVLSWFRIGG